MDESLGLSAPDPLELVYLCVLILRESDGNHPPELLKELIQQLDRAIEETLQGVPPEPIDTIPFAAPDDAETQAAVRKGMELALDLIRPVAADNPRRKAEIDALATRPDGVAQLAALQGAATANLYKTIRRFLRGNMEGLEAEIVED